MPTVSEKKTVTKFIEEKAKEFNTVISDFRDETKQAIKTSINNVNTKATNAKDEAIEKATVASKKLFDSIKKTTKMPKLPIRF